MYSDRCAERSSKQSAVARISLQLPSAAVHAAVSQHDAECGACARLCCDSDAGPGPGLPALHAHKRATLLCTQPASCPVIPLGPARPFFHPPPSPHQLKLRYSHSICAVLLGQVNAVRKSGRFAWVEFATLQASQQALTLDGESLGAGIMKVSQSKTPIHTAGWRAPVRSALHAGCAADFASCLFVCQLPRHQGNTFRWRGS